MNKDRIAIIILSIIVIVESALLIHLWSQGPQEVPEVAVAQKGEIAIVIDDWGYNLDNLDILDEIKYPLTCSILPKLNYSRRIAEELHKRRFQIILHLPMEPEERYRLEKDTIMLSMDEENIRDIIDKDLISIVYAKGVSNHMGSRATQDRRVMEIVFKELKRRKLFFLDSLVSSKSICSDLAREMNLDFTKRDIFLDNKKDPGYIKKQIHKLKKRADIYGKAIGIGHARRSTLETLKEVMPELEREGYKFVFASELIK